MTPSSPLITASQVSKHYVSQTARAGGLTALRNAWNRRSPADPFIALDDVSFEVHRGESLAIIGENGAGKSTLLKLIAAVVKPTQGSVVVNGSMSALLELGSGFHPEYTGAENIELSAALLGIPAAQFLEKRAEIIAFADIGDALFKPVKTYSSGMIVRLGFAVATAVNPDLLITDEVMAVGDEAFQKKCIRWVEGYLKRGGTLLLVSHSMYHVQKLCSHAMWLEKGRVREAGDAISVSQRYLAYSQQKSAQESIADHAHAQANGLYRVQNALLNHDPLPATLSMGDSLTVTAEVISPDGRTPHVLLGLLREDGTAIYGTGSEFDGVKLTQTAPQVFAVHFTYDAPPLLPGGYIVRLHAMDPEGMRLFDTVERTFVITGQTREMGTVRLPHRWQG
jgi:lipopolysaccharide transport system ATP-binding protein